MRVLKTDRKEGLFEAIPESFDDLWHIEKLIDQGDLVSGSSERKIKATREGEKAFKQKIFVELEAEKTEFHEATNQLRVQGVVTQAKPEELVELGAHHTIEVEPGQKIMVKKKALKNYHLERLERARKGSTRGKALIVIMDDEEAELAFLKDIGIEQKARILAGKQGKRMGKGDNKRAYFEELLGKIKELRVDKIVVAGPGFEKQNFEKFLKEKNSVIKATFESTNSVGITGLNELIKSGKIDKLIAGFHVAEEARAVEKVLEGLSSGKAAVGLSEVKKAVEAGAVEELVVEEKLLSVNRNEVEELLEKTEQLNGRIVFASQKNDAGKKLDGLGGIAATLRYKLW